MYEYLFIMVTTEQYAGPKEPVKRPNNNYILIKLQMQIYGSGPMKSMNRCSC